MDKAVLRYRNHFSYSPQSIFLAHICIGKSFEKGFAISQCRPL